MKKRMQLLALLILAAPALAQGGRVTSPATLAGNEGNSSWDWSGGGASTIMQIHGDLTAPVTIKGLAWRPDVAAASTQARTINLTIRLSTTPVAWRAPKSLFSANHGPDLTEVLTRTNLVLPPCPTTGSGPRPFLPTIPFSRTFAYAGPLVGNLAWEARIHSCPASTLCLDRHQENQATGSSYGTGGSAAGLTLPAAHLVSVRSRGNDLVLTPSGLALPDHATYYWLLGCNCRSYGPLPLPMSLAGIGGRDNWLLLEPLVNLVGTTDGSGQAGVMGEELVIPRTPFLAGRTIYSQLAALDLGHPSFPLVLTNGFALTMPPDLPVCSLATGGDDGASLAGCIDTHAGLVTSFIY